MLFLLQSYPYLPQPTLICVDSFPNISLQFLFSLQNRGVWLNLKAEMSEKARQQNNWWNYYFFKHCTNVLFYIFVETCHFAKWILMAQHLYFVDCSKLTFRNHFNSNLKFLFLPNCILSYKKCWKHGLSPIYKWANRTNILSIMMVLDTNVKI